jgi:hypothetical protein
MGTLLVVGAEVGRQARLQLRHHLIIINVDILVFSQLSARPEIWEFGVIQDTGMTSHIAHLPEIIVRG